MYWITICWFKHIPNSISLSKTWLNQVEKWEKANGPIWTIAHIKMMRQLLFSHLSGNPQKVVSQIIGINRNNGLPKALKDFYPLILSKDTKSIRFVLTLLSISRALPGIKTPDLTSITNPPVLDQEFILGLESDMDWFLSKYQWDASQLPSWFSKNQLRFSPKAGPNGSASRTSLFDLVSMPQELLLILKSTNIKSVIEEYGKLLSPKRVKFFHTVQSLWPKFEQMNKKKYNSPSWFDQFRSKEIKGNIRKLSIVNDPEAKARIIAIFDYWSQTWLRQIHEIHFNFLKRIPFDRTFTQDPIITSDINGHKYYSFDLSSATDRFPMSLQRLMMKHMFDDELANKWKSILVDFPFYVPWESKLHDTFVSYNAGQPMGAYSSWSTFTITHHYLLHVIHKRLGLTEMFYQILGDDIVIWNDDVAKEYQEYMRKLGVGISIPKSNISSNMYEFAKRIFINGKEITGIQLGGFINNYSKYHLIYQNLFTLVYERGYYPLDLISIPEMLYRLFKILGKKEKECINIRSRSKLLHAFNKFIIFGDSIPLMNRFKELYPNSNFQSVLPDLEFNNLIYLSCDKVLRKINADYVNYGQRLLSNPRLVEQAAIGLADPSDMWTSPLYYISKLPIMEGLKNNIILQNKARNLDSIRDMVKAIALPTDNIFEKRNAILLSNCNAKLAKNLLSEFKAQQIDNKLAAMPEFNLGGAVLSYIVSDMKKSIDPMHGFGVQDKPKPKGNPMDWGLSCNNDMMN